MRERNTQESKKKEGKHGIILWVFFSYRNTFDKVGSSLLSSW